MHTWQRGRSVSKLLAKHTDMKHRGQTLYSWITDECPTHKGAMFYQEFFMNSTATAQ